MAGCYREVVIIGRLNICGMSDKRLLQGGGPCGEVTIG